MSGSLFALDLNPSPAMIWALYFFQIARIALSLNISNQLVTQSTTMVALAPAVRIVRTPECHNFHAFSFIGPGGWMGALVMVQFFVLQSQRNKQASAVQLWSALMLKMGAMI
jgi:hypothetical protein